MAGTPSQTSKLTEGQELKEEKKSERLEGDG